MLRRTLNRPIRTVLPPRPNHTVIAYLDHYGNPIKSRQETDLSLIRTRDNKFYIQRVFHDESVVRFPAPGLAMIKNASNFEYFSLTDLDLYGGVLVPMEICPSLPSERPSYHDAVYIIMRCHPTDKFTRKDRRAYHRRMHAYWAESPEQYHTNYVMMYGCLLVLGVYLSLRWLNNVYRGVPWYDEDHLFNRDDNVWSKAYRFARNHPEHMNILPTTLNFSPALESYSQTRAEIRQAESIDPSMQWEWVFKVQHLKQYGHWPASLATGSLGPPEVEKHFLEDLEKRYAKKREENAFGTSGRPDTTA
jgi:hypothetical protein